MTIRFDVTLSTAIKAVWLLYSWGNWTLLGEIGLRKDLHAKQLDRFDLIHLGDSDLRVGQIGHGEQEAVDIAFLMSYCPDTILAATCLLSKYEKKWGSMVYHARVSDEEAMRIEAKYAEPVKQVGGNLSACLGMGAVDAVLVLNLPEHLHPYDLILGPDWQEAPA